MMFTSFVQTVNNQIITWKRKSKLVFRFAQRLIILKRLKSLQWESVSCASSRDTNFKIEINSISRIFLNILFWKIVTLKSVRRDWSLRDLQKIELIDYKLNRVIQTRSGRVGTNSRAKQSSPTLRSRQSGRSNIWSSGCGYQ